jgi:hypothetical protein
MEKRERGHQSHKPSSLYGVWWALSLLSIGLSVPLLFMTSDDDPFLFCPLGCLSFSLWPLMTRGHEEKKDKQPDGKKRRAYQQRS